MAGERISCIFCGKDSTNSSYNSKTLAQRKHKKFWSKWTSNCCDSICALLSLPVMEPFTSIFTNGGYCNSCTELVLDMDFSLRKIKILEAKIRSSRTWITNSLTRHFDMLKLENSEVKAKNVNFRDLEDVMKGLRNSVPVVKTDTDRTMDNFTKPEVNVKSEPTELIGEHSSLYHAYDISGTDISSSKRVKRETAKHSSEERKNQLESDFYCNEPELVSDEIDDEGTGNSLKREQNKKSKPSGKALPCVKCNEVFKNGNALFRHTTSTHPGETFECPKCPRSFRVHTTLIEHIENIHRLKPFSCSTCLKGFTNQEDLEKHEQFHFSANPFQCSDCLTVFNNSPDLQIHMREHEFPFACDRCKKCFATKAGLKTHIDYHERKRRCNICGQHFPSSSKVARHKAMEHNIGRRKFTCTICNINYTQAVSLRRHEASKHRGERPYACSICPKRFFSTQMLKNHETIHSGIKSYTCLTCGKQFQALHYLQQHEETHDPTKPRKKRPPRSKLQCEIAAASIPQHSSSGPSVP